MFTLLSLMSIFFDCMTYYRWVILSITVFVVWWWSRIRFYHIISFDYPWWFFLKADIYRLFPFLPRFYWFLKYKLLYNVLFLNLKRMIVFIMRIFHWIFCKFIFALLFLLRKLKHRRWKPFWFFSSINWCPRLKFLNLRSLIRFIVIIVDWLKVQSDLLIWFLQLYGWRTPLFIAFLKPTAFAVFSCRSDLP